ncbi:hypothetical protein LUZ60_002924 [Juncus effusus]|nr:hypothetical protein LUZ60_002924 [Juncus effusus]
MKVILKNYVKGKLRESDMNVVKEDIKVMGSRVLDGSIDQIMLKDLYLSCDPYMRGRMTKHDDTSYIPNFVPGEVITGHGVSKVVDSTHADFKVGDLVWGITGWEEFSLISNPQSFIKINHPEMPLSYYTGILGLPGFTEYIGFHKMASPKKGEYLLISATAVRVGQLVGKFAKLVGCYVVGAVGSDQEVELLKNKFGFDDAFNYKKESDYNEALKSYCEFEVMAMQYIKEGKLTYLEDIVEGLENAPSALVGLFEGRNNVGKQVVVVSKE